MSNLRSLLLVLLCWGASLSWCSGQTVQQDSLLHLISASKADSTKARLLVELANSYIRSDWKKQYEYAAQALRILEKDGDQRLRADALYIAGSSFRPRDEPSDSALVYFEQGIQLCEAIGYTVKIADFYNGFGAHYHVLGVYDKAFEYYQQAIAVAEEEGLRQALCRYQNNAGLILLLTGEKERALPYFHQALEVAEELEDRLIISAVLSNIGIVHSELGRYDLALECYTRSLEVRRTINDKIGEALTICNIGNVHRRKGLFELALQYQHEGLELAEEIDFTRGRSVCLEGITFTYFDWEKYEETIEYAEIGLALSERNGLLENQVDFKNLSAQSYAKLGDMEKAYELTQEYIVIRDSLNSMEASSQINELEAKYQLRQKETENQLIREREAGQQTAIRNRNILIGGTLALLVLISLLAFSYYRTSQQKQAYNNQLKRAVDDQTIALNQTIDALKDTNHELENFAFIASHDLKEPLRSMVSFNNLIQKKLAGQLTDETKEYFAFVNNSGQQMYQLIESTLEFSRLTKSEGVYELVDTAELVEQTKENLQRLIQQQQAIVEADPLPSIQSIPDQLYLVFKNLIENGIKYNTNPQPKVSIRYQQKDAHEFTFTDNGIGIAREFHDKIFEMFKRLHSRAEYPGSGLGLSIVHKIVHRLGGSISLESEVGKGSVFVVRIPLDQPPRQET